MVCKKCGAEINEECAFCPKCGKSLTKKKKLGTGKIIGISALAVAVLGAGIFLFASGYYKTIIPDAQNVTATAETDIEVASDETEPQETKVDDISETVIAESQESEVDDTLLAAETEPSELEQYLSALTLEPVEMTIGETFRVELEKAVPNAAWVSSAENIALVTDGQIKAVAVGNASITLSAEGKEVSFDVTVHDFPNMTLAVNCSAAIELNDSLTNVQWESSAPEIVAVSEGTITSLAAGAAMVTAHINDTQYSFEVVATTPEISTTSVRKIIGNTAQIFFMGTNGKAEWKSDNTAIATVSDTGLITAEPTGAGQSTVVHAFIDGMEFKIDVAVEPIPQLSSTYKIYGHQDSDTVKNANITLCTNANEIIKCIVPQYDQYGDRASREVKKEVKTVLNVADADYSDGYTYPLYRGYMNISYKFDRIFYTGCTDIYLVGTSQTADVLIQRMDGMVSNDAPDALLKSTSVVTYEPNDNFGIIHVYLSQSAYAELVTVSVDGYQYQFVVLSMPDYVFMESKIDNIPVNYIIEEYSVDEIVTISNTSYSSVTSNSRTYYTGNDWLERIGTKFVNEVEDQAIEMAVGFLFKAIFF